MNYQYRKNVGIVVCRDGLVLMCARADSIEDHWQFPQGGIDEKEDIVTAAKRELFEETGIKSVSLIAKYPEPLRYDFISGKKVFNGVSYRGQEQSWVLFKFDGNDSEINLKTNPEEIEFKKYEWTEINTAPQKIAEFKRDVYRKVVAFFADFVKEKSNEQ